MAKSALSTDPDWAWAPYEPAAGQPWTRREVAHLYRRAGFGADSRTLDEAVGKSPGEVVRQLLLPDTEDRDFRFEMDRMADIVRANGDARRLAAWWLYRMMHTPYQPLEKLVLFWHGHFATSAAKVQDAELMYDQHRLLRKNALGDFAQLAQQMAQDPAMLIYLDSATNRKAHPNENFARELMELFCLGEGNYTERDIRELARCFTGWEIKRKRYRFNRYQHDFGVKSVFGQSGPFSGSDAVSLVVAQKSAPQYIATKLVRFFVMDSPQPDPELIRPLAEQFRREDLQIAPLVMRILSSRIFFSSQAIGRRIRSPVELSMGMLRALEATTDTTQLEGRLHDVGHALFFPPNVKGWDGGRTWINSSTLLGRANLVRAIMQDKKTRFGGGSLAELCENYGVDSPAGLVDWLSELLMAVSPPKEVRGQLISLAATPGADRDQMLVDLISAMSTLPEFQLG